MLRVQELQKVLAEVWVPYMKDLDTVYTDASCYDSHMRFPTDVKLLWNCVERAYKMMCGISSALESIERRSSIMILPGPVCLIGSSASIPISRQAERRLEVITKVYRQQKTITRVGM